MTVLNISQHVGLRNTFPPNLKYNAYRQLLAIKYVIVLSHVSIPNACNII